MKLFQHYIFIVPVVYFHLFHSSIFLLFWIYKTELCIYVYDDTVKLFAIEICNTPCYKSINPQH
jgi:hypothetical protein